LAKVLVGEQPCLLEPWLSGHFKFDKVNRDPNSLATWKINHTELLSKVTEQYLSDGWKPQVEQFFRVTGVVAVLNGKVDLIVKKPDCRPKIVDAKTGEVRESDVVQVAIEMIALPMAWGVHMTFDGEVVYPTHTVPVRQADADRIRPALFKLLKHLALDSRPAASPGEGACRFCEVPASECPDRFVPETAIATTMEF